MDHTSDLNICSVSVDHSTKLEAILGGVYSLQYSPDGQFLAIGCGSGTIRLYNVKTGQKTPDVRKTRYGGYPIMVLRFHPKKLDLVYAGTSDGRILSCDISDFISDKLADHAEHASDERWREITTEMKGFEKNEINCLDFDSTKQRYATAGKDLNIRIYDANTNQLIREYTGYESSKSPVDVQYSGCAHRVFALKFHPEHEDIFITGGWERHLKIWDARSQDGVRRTIHGPHVCGDALDIKDDHILTGSYVAKDALQIWNYSTEYRIDGSVKPKVVNFPEGEKGQYLYAAKFCAGDIVVAGGSGTNSAVVINSTTDKIIGEIKFEHAVQAIDAAAAGHLFAVGDGSGCVTMCSLK